jgi:Cu(I)/Ag(I) efflux system protein CusF
MKFLLAAAAVVLIASPALAQTAGATASAGQPRPASADTGTKATGQIKSVDAKAGTVTIHHSPIPALGWPAMTMIFKATPEALKAAKTGQTVSFTLTKSDNQVVAIQPQ